MPQLDSLQTIKDIAHTVGYGAAPVAITTGNHVANVITIISAIALFLPKLADIFLSIKSLFNKKQNNQNITDVTIN